MTELAKVLVIEDDADIWRSLQVLLGRAGYSVVWAGDGPEGLRRFEDDRPDLVILDIGLPRLDGWSVLERIRHRNETPILLLTARGLETDKVRGLLGGADDYLTKPYSNNELVARVGALLRRLPPNGDAEPSVFDDGWLRVDFANHEVTRDGVDVRLTPAEFRLLAVLVRRSGTVVSRSDILEQAWKDRTGTGQSRVKFTVVGLRRKLGEGLTGHNVIENVRGFGYRYARPNL
ncbi:MAG: response regulator transcription factor [Acidimicrobiales bacterium]